MREEPGISPRDATIKSMDEITDGADRHRAGAVGGVPADGLLRRLGGRDLPPVLDHHRLVDGAVGDRRPGADAGAGGDPAASARRGASRRQRAGSGAAPLRRPFNAWFERMAERYRARRDARDRADAASPWSSMPRSVAVLVLVFLQPARRASCRRRTRASRSCSTRCRRAPPRRAPLAAVKEIEHYFLTEEKDNVDAPSIAVVGQGQAGAGQNAGRGFLSLQALGPSARARRTPPRPSPSAPPAQLGGQLRDVAVLRAQSAAGARASASRAASPSSCSTPAA